MKPFKRKKYADYAKEVNRGLQDGEFADCDLIEHTIDPFILKFKNREKFEIHALLCEGKTTGWGKCSTCANKRNRNSVFKISDGFSGMRDESVRRHCRTAHSTEEEKEAARKENLRAKSQLPVTDFLRQRQLPPQMISEMREMNMKIIASTHTPLSFFSKQVVKDRDRKLLEICGFDPNEVDKFDKSAESLKRDARKIARENRDIIRKNIRREAKEGRVGVGIDHKAVLNQNGDIESHALGVSVLHTDEEFQRRDYLIDFIPTSKQDAESTVPLARGVLEVNSFMYI